MSNLFEQHLNTANALLQENDVMASIEYYDKALQMAPSPKEKIDLHNTLGKLYQSTKNPEKAIAAFEQSVLLYGTSANDKPSPDQAAVYNNLGALYLLTDLKKSIANFAKALQTYGLMAEAGREIAPVYLGNTHFAIAGAHMQKKNIHLAKKHFKEAIQYFEKSTGEDHETLKASSYYNLGNLYTDEFNLYDAKTSYTKALLAYNAAMANDLTRLQPYVAATHNNLGITFKSLGNPQKALDHFNLALDHYLELALNNPHNFLPFVAATHNSIGILYGEKKDVERAIDHIEKSSVIYDGLLKENLVEYTHYWGTSLHNLGLFHLELKNIEESEGYFLKALKIRKSLAQQEPQAFNADVCATSLNLVELYQAQMEINIDMTLKTDCLDLLDDIDRRLAKFDTKIPVLKTMKSDCHYYRGYFNAITKEKLTVQSCLKKGDALTEEINSTIIPTEKLVFQNQIVTLLEESLRGFPDHASLKNDLVLAYNNLAWLHIRTKKYAQAESIIKKAMELNQPHNPLLCNLAHAYLLQGRVAEAKSLYAQLLHKENSEKDFFKTVIQKDVNTLKKDGANNKSIAEINKILKGY